MLTGQLRLHKLVIQKDRLRMACIISIVRAVVVLQPGPTFCRLIGLDSFSDVSD